MTNFVGYVAWCLWLIAMAVTLWRSLVRGDEPSEMAMPTVAGTYVGR